MNQPTLMGRPIGGGLKQWDLQGVPLTVEFELDGQAKTAQGFVGQGVPLPEAAKVIGWKADWS